jgi:hypothetical protein
MSYFIHNILAIALPSLRISPLLIRIGTIALLYAVAMFFIVIYIQSIGSGKGIFSGLFHNFLFTNSSIGLEEISLLLFSSLVPIKPKRLTKTEKESFSLSQELKDILIGLLLGDLFVQKQKVNARFVFRQGTIHKNYLWHLYELFSNYTTSIPKTYNMPIDKRTGKVYSGIYFQTYSLPCFVPLFNLFYFEGNKIIPTNINELLTVHSLGYWLCDDGNFCKSTHRVRISTESFTLAQVDLLVQTLNDKWNLKCYKVKSSNSYRIVIPQKSLKDLQSLLKDVMPSMMLYKIGL